MIAYISRLVYPDPQANALQTIQMASALANENCDAHLFVHDMVESEDQIRQKYAVDNSPLRIWSLHTGYMPRFIYRRAKTRFLAYNFAVSTILGVHPIWRRSSAQKKVIFVRSRLELLFWGLLKSYMKWLQDWVFVYEAHDLQLDTAGNREKRRSRTINALKSFDLVLCTTQSLAGDLSELSSDVVKCHVLPMSTALPRLGQLPEVKFSHGRVLLGYVGTVDSLHAVRELVDAIKILPDRYALRFVGRIGLDTEVETKQWMKDPILSNRIEFVPPIDYSQVKTEIDGCDILLAPAGSTVHSLRYRSPLKLFDYMARGKPIVAASAPSHKELLEDGVNARLYRPGDPTDLAAKIMSLAEQPQRAQAIAHKAWEDSTNYTYDARAKRVVELVDETWDRRCRKESRSRELSPSSTV